MQGQSHVRERGDRAKAVGPSWSLCLSTPAPHCVGLAFWAKGRPVEPGGTSTWLRATPVPGAGRLPSLGGRLWTAAFAIRAECFREQSTRAPVRARAQRWKF